MQKVTRFGLTALISTALLSISLLTWADSREVVNESHNVSANEKIYIEVMSGEIIIKAVKASKFAVNGKLDGKATGYLLDTKDGFSRFEMTMPRQVNYTKEDKDNMAELNFEVPVGSHIEFTGVNGNVKVSGIHGSSEITTVNGMIMADDLRTTVKLRTVNGQIKVNGANGHIELNSVNGEIDDKNSSGRLHYEVVNGQINAISSAEEVNISTVNGDAELTLNGTRTLKLSTVNGEVEAALRGVTNPQITGSSVSGDIALKLESSASVRVEIKASAGGSVDNKLSNDKATKAKYGPARSLQFTLGSGEGSVELTTVSGDIKLEKL